MRVRKYMVAAQLRVVNHLAQRAVHVRVGYVIPMKHALSPVHAREVEAVQ